MSVGAPEPSDMRQVVFLNRISTTVIAEGVWVRRSPSTTNRDRRVCRDGWEDVASAATSETDQVMKLMQESDLERAWGFDSLHARLQCLPQRSCALHLLFQRQ